MTDIDFDELDKAVNSLMDQAPQKQSTTTEQPAASTPEAAPAVSAPTEPTTVATIEQPAPVSDTPAAEPAVATAPAAPAAPTPESEASAQPTQAASIVPKRRGQFMDVMHPSSDMTTAAKQQTTPPTRSGANLAPLNPDVAPKQSVDTTTGPVSTTPTTGDAHTPEQSSADTMPDPIDMHAAQQQEPAPVVSTPPAPAPEPQSPFLPDAKVEKTPLGSAAPTATPATSETPEQPNQDTMTAASTDTEPVAEPTPSADDTVPTESGEVVLGAPPEPAAKPLPEELSSDVLSVESDTNQHALSEAKEPSSKAPDLQSSIVPQYKEKKSDGDGEEHAPMYDSTTQPLAHPPKKKSGLVTIIMIVVLILLGAGGAAAVYFFDLL